MNVAFLGLGAMGGRMARRLLLAGHRVTVYNRSIDRGNALVAAGAVRASTPRKAVESAEAVFSSVTDDEASAEIWMSEKEGALGGMRKNSIAVECSTLSLAGMEHIANAANRHEIAFLDAPVVGSRPQADAGQLVFLVGGSPLSLERIRTPLAAMGSVVLHIGDSGQGIRLKLLINAFFGLQAVALGELLGAAEHLGMDRARTAELLASLPISSPAAVGLLKAMSSGNHAPQAPLAILEKDLRYLLSGAKPTGTSMPVTDAAHRQLKRAVKAGLAELNISGIARLYTESTN